MAIYSPLRSRRLATQQTEATQRSIVFKLGEETFAIPLDRVEKVTTLDRLYGDPNGTGVSLTTYDGRELVVIDVGYRVFGRSQQVLLPPQPKSSSAVAAVKSSNLVRYLLILQPQPGRLVGLPIDSPPKIESIQLSAFQPLPAIYQQYSNIHCVSAISTWQDNKAIDSPIGAAATTKTRSAMFLLDVDSLGSV